MATIRSDLPATAPASPIPSVGARNAQAAFFRAALAQVGSAAPATEAQRVTTVAPSAATDRPLRPGSLLDIKV